MLYICVYTHPCSEFKIFNMRSKCNWGFFFICKIIKLQDIENGSAKGSTPNVLDYRDGGIYDEIDKDSATPDKNGKPNGTARSTEDVYAVPDKRKSNPPESPKLGTPKYIMVSNCINIISKYSLLPRSWQIAVF